MFLENQGTVDICVEKSGFTPETIQVILFGGMYMFLFYWCMYMYV